MSATTVHYVSSACIQDCRDIGSVLERYAALKIPRVELGSNHAYRPGLLELVQSYSFDYVLHNYFPPAESEFILNLASPDDALRQRSIEQLRTCIEFAVKIGAPLVSFHAGFAQDPDLRLNFNLEPAIAPDVRLAEKRFADSLQDVQKCGRDHGIELAVENNVVGPHHFRNGYTPLMYSRPEECLPMAQHLDPDLAGILLDIGHLNVSAHVQGFDRDTFVTQLGPYVRAVHVHENDGSKDQHRGLTNGSWFEGTVKKLQTQARYVTLESGKLTNDQVLENSAILDHWLTG